MTIVVAVDDSRSLRAEEALCWFNYLSRPYYAPLESDRIGHRGSSEPNNDEDHLQ